MTWMRVHAFVLYKLLTNTWTVIYLNLNLNWLKYFIEGIFHDPILRGAFGSL